MHMCMHVICIAITTNHILVQVILEIKNLITGDSSPVREILTLLPVMFSVTVIGVYTRSVQISGMALIALFSRMKAIFPWKGKRMIYNVIQYTS